jgi:electron transfer flavoprotein alpha/beta subunit
MKVYMQNSVWVCFGQLPIVITLPTGTKEARTAFLRQRIKAHANSLVKNGFWDKPITQSEVDEVISELQAEICPKA